MEDRIGPRRVPRVDSLSTHAGHADLHAERGILSHNWKDYTCDKVVLQPKQMSPERPRELFDEAWKIFHREKPQPCRMLELFKKVIDMEVVDGSFRRRQGGRANWKCGRGEA